MSTDISPPAPTAAESWRNPCKWVSAKEVWGPVPNVHSVPGIELGTSPRCSLQPHNNSARGAASFEYEAQGPCSRESEGPEIQPRGQACTALAVPAVMPPPVVSVFYTRQEWEHPEGSLPR